MNENEREFSRRRNLPGVEVRYYNMKRVSDVMLHLRAAHIGTKTTVLCHNKVQSVSYSLPEID